MAVTSARRSRTRRLPRLGGRARVGADEDADRDASPTMIGPPPFEAIAPQDPLRAFLQAHAEPVDLRRLKLDSPAVEALREAGVELMVPLVAHGELVGILNLGPRLSEQEYSAEDRRLLARLASHAAPALRVAQLVRQQEAEARERERYEQEMQLVQLIQQHFLPSELPHIDGWGLDAVYRPAREVGGDFYDVVELDDGRLGLLVADVTDKGVPAGFVMASARSILRAAVQRLVEPGAVLRRANDQLHPDMPPNMFVTCLYGVLDPTSGLFRFANAGHNLPCVQTADGAVEVRATGMPLGLMPTMEYEEAEVTVDAGHSLLLYSDALPEAHGPDGEMFGFPRLVDVVGAAPEPQDLISHLLAELATFTGPGWEQEDDITMVAVHRVASADTTRRRLDDSATDRAELDRFIVPFDAVDERAAMQRVGEVVGALGGLAPAQLEGLRSAVAEAVMNAVEHGNAGRTELPVELRVLASSEDVLVEVTDQGVGEPLPDTVVEPDLEAKLRGEQSPRGWGLFLIRELLDDLRVHRRDPGQTIALVLKRNGGQDG